MVTHQVTADSKAPRTDNIRNQTDAKREKSGSSDSIVPKEHGSLRGSRR